MSPLICLQSIYAKLHLAESRRYYVQIIYPSLAIHFYQIPLKNLIKVGHWRPEVPLEFARNTHKNEFSFTKIVHLNFEKYQLKWHIYGLHCVILQVLDSHLKYLGNKAMAMTAIISMETVIHGSRNVPGRSLVR